MIAFRNRKGSFQPEEGQRQQRVREREGHRGLGERRDGETRTETVRERKGSDGGGRNRKRNQRHTHEPAPLLKQKGKVCISQLT